MERRLAAILYADVAGYSRLTGLDEEETHRKLNTGLNLLTDVIEAHGGQKLHEAGDAVLSEFNSVTEAVAGALEFQTRMIEQNANIAEEHRFHFRIGVNLGEVIHDREDIYGDGVNLAARIQEIAQPGGVCVSGAVYEQIAGKTEQEFDDLGYRRFKNIDQPVHVYQARVAGVQLREENRSGWFVDKRKPVATGGCLCGKVRFEVLQEPLVVGYCHCRYCQRAVGGALGVSLVFEKTAVRFLGEEPSKYKSSDIAERGFCGTCGTSITTTHYAPDESNFYAIRIGAMDEPAEFPPTFHWAVENQLPWLDIRDALPRLRSDEDTELQRRWKAVGRPNPKDQLP